MSEPSDGPAKTPATTIGATAPATWARVVGLALVMIAFTAIGMFAYSVYARGADSAVSGRRRGGASTLVRASTLTTEPAPPLAKPAAPPPVETPRALPDAAPRVNRARAPKAQAAKLRYWRATAAEPDVGF